MTTAERSSSGENSSRPIAFAPSRHARPSAAWRANAASSPSSSSSPSATSSDATSETAGVNGVDPVSSDALHSLPVEVEARRRRPRDALPRRRRDGREREPGRSHERLLRAGDDDVEAPGVGLERHRAEARHGVDDVSAPALVRDPRERLDVGDDAGRRLRVHEDDDLGARLLEARAKVVRPRRLAPGVPELVDVGAVGGRERGPALAELARRDDEHALARREQVHDRRLERAGARTR